MDKSDPTARAAQEHAKRNRRYLFAAIDAVMIGGMVGIGVFFAGGPKCPADVGRGLREAPYF